jgi:hypothetical protein
LTPRHVDGWRGFIIRSGVRLESISMMDNGRDGDGVLRGVFRFRRCIHTPMGHGTVLIFGGIRICGDCNGHREEMRI